MARSEIEAPEFSRDRILVVPDERFSPETVAIVTGAASGIGRATALAPAHNGLTVVAAEGEGDVRSFSLSTAYVKTPLVVDQIEDTARNRGITEREVVEDVMLGEARVTELMGPIEVANVFAFAFSKHGRFLDGGDLLFDGGYTLTY